MLSVDFHRGAIRDAIEGRRFYMRRGGIVAARRFEIALQQAIDRAAQFPNAGSPTLKNTRTYLLRKFPYSLIYIVRSVEVFVVAVAHKDRRPGYWMRRVP